MPQSKALFLRR